MSKGWYYSPGEWNFICDVCAQKHKSGIARQRWDGMMVCPGCFEHRHPQDFLRSKTDRISVPWTRPIKDIFTDDSTTVLTLSISDSVSVSDTGTQTLG